MMFVDPPRTPEERKAYLKGLFLTLFILAAFVLSCVYFGVKYL